MHSIVIEARSIIKSNKYRKLLIALSESMIYQRGIARAAMVDIHIARRIAQRAKENRNRKNVTTISEM